LGGKKREKNRKKERKVKIREILEQIPFPRRGGADFSLWPPRSGGGAGRCVKEARCRRNAAKVVQFHEAARSRIRNEAGVRDNKTGEAGFVSFCWEGRVTLINLTPSQRLILISSDINQLC
jgi:hypothetical protein